MAVGRDDPARPHSPRTETVHASCVAFDGRAVLITGASGSGKSALALNLIALGGGLVSDDRTCIWRDADQIWADAPERLSGLIEARQVGILRIPPAGPHAICLVITMDACETERLPEPQETWVLEVALPILRKSELPHFSAAIATYLRGQRYA